MILDAIIKLALAMLKGILALFPTYSMPESITNLGAATGTWAGTLNQFVPIRTLGICVLILLTAQLFVYVVRLLIFIYQLVPFKAT